MREAIINTDLSQREDYGLSIKHTHEKSLDDHDLPREALLGRVKDLDGG